MPIAIDFETYLISEESVWPKPVCLSYFDGTDEGLLTEEKMGHYLQKILVRDTIIAHNAVFECGVIYTWFPKLRKLLWRALKEGRIICTKIAEEVINLSRKSQVNKFSLAALVNTYFSVDLSAEKTDPDAWRLRYSELDGVPVEQWPEKAQRYAIEDSIWAFKLHQVQSEDPLNTSRQVRAAVTLNLMGSFGIRVDKERVEQLEQEIYNALEPKYEMLLEDGYCEQVKGKRRPKKNVKMLQELVEETVPTPKYSPKGNILVSKAALEDYYEETGNEVFKYFLDINVYDKVLTAYVKNLKGQDIIRSKYSTTKSTGRTSSSGDRNYPSVNIQQMPRKVPDVTWDVRNCFIPREGYVLVSIDYAGLELASAAHQLYRTFNYSKMRDTLNSGSSPTDMHSKLACQIMSRKVGRKVTYDEFLGHKKESEYASFRQLSKPINLGFPGGIGFRTMRMLLAQDGIKTKFIELGRFSSESIAWRKCFQLRMEEHEENLRVERVSPSEWAVVYDDLVGLKNDLFEVYPELKQFLKEHHEKALTGEFKKVKNEYGEWESDPVYKYSVGGFTRDWCNYTAYCNGYLMQSPSAVGATQMASEVIERYIEDPTVNPLAFIHDEMLLEVIDNDDKYAIINDISELMIDEMQKVLTSVRITVEAEVMDYWRKAGGSWSRQYWKNPGDSELHYE